VLVVRKEDVGPRNVERPPLLVIEVLSPTTRAKDADVVPETLTR
jgi:Uma2 family endonuclease